MLDPDFDARLVRVICIPAGPAEAISLGVPTIAIVVNGACQSTAQTSGSANAAITAVSIVLAKPRAPALSARATDFVVFAEATSSAISALAAKSAVRAHTSPSAVPARAAHPVVLAQAFSSARLASIAKPAMDADFGAPAMLASAALSAVRTETVSSAVAADVTPLPVDADAAAAAVDAVVLLASVRALCPHLDALGGRVACGQRHENGQCGDAATSLRVDARRSGIGSHRRVHGGAEVIWCR